VLSALGGGGAFLFRPTFSIARVAKCQSAGEKAFAD
jgi:hypothetical protein